MKKFLVAMAAALLIGGSAFAMDPQILQDEAALGGITPGMDVETIEEYYGPGSGVNPIYSKAQGMWIDKLTYGGTVEITLGGRDPGSMKTEMIVVTGNNGWETPSGIHVGSTVNDLVNAYGYPYLPKSASTGNPNGYWYYKAEKSGNMVFHLENGIVTRIALGWDW